MKKILYLILLSFCSILLLSVTLKPSVENCDFYLDLELTKRCGFEGYPISYGYKYCDKFSNVCSKRLTGENATRWLNGTKYCLQKMLANPSVETMNCDSLANFAFNSHPFCYTSGSALFGGMNFCLLDIGDMLDIADCIGDADLLSERSIRQIEELSLICIDLLLQSTNHTYTESKIYGDTETMLQLKELSKNDFSKKMDEFLDLLSKIEGLEK